MVRITRDVMHLGDMHSVAVLLVSEPVENAVCFNLLKGEVTAVYLNDIKIIPHDQKASDPCSGR